MPCWMKASSSRQARSWVKSTGCSRSWVPPRSGCLCQYGVVQDKDKFHDPHPAEVGEAFGHAAHLEAAFFQDPHRGEVVMGHSGKQRPFGDLVEQLRQRLAGDAFTPERLADPVGDSRVEGQATDRDIATTCPSKTMVLVMVRGSVSVLVQSAMKAAKSVGSSAVNTAMELASASSCCSKKMGRSSAVTSRKERVLVIAGSRNEFKPAQCSLPAFVA